MTGRDGLAPPVVAPEAYTEDYFLHGCAGHEPWARTGGREVDGAYHGYLARAGLRPGERLVDVGTGRGEALVVARQLGAARATGVEYSTAGHLLARRTIEAHGAGDRCEVRLADARALPVDDGQADLVTYLDVVEHLAPEELAQSLTEAWRVLRPGGRLFAHTMPTRTVYAVTYRWQRALVPGRRRTWPRDPRHDDERAMHVNEQTRRRLARTLRAAGFDPVQVRLGCWVYTDFVPDEAAKRTYHRLARIRPLAGLGVCNLFALAHRPAVDRGQPTRRR